MDISIFLARIEGLFLFLFSIPLLFNYFYLQLTFEELIKSKTCSFIISIVALLISIVLIMVHNVWVMDWRVIITLLGWLILFKSLAWLYYPLAMQKIIAPGFLNAKVFITAGTACMILSFVLIYHGFFS